MQFIKRIEKISLPIDLTCDNQKNLNSEKFGRTLQNIFMICPYVKTVQVTEAFTTFRTFCQHPFMGA